ncbi:peptidoglycan-binding protein [Methylobacterium sp. A54F]
MRDHREIIVAGEARSARPSQSAGQPPRRRAPSARQEAGELRAALGYLARGAARHCRANPLGVLGATAATGAAALVCLNALGFQVGRHPAPILPKIATRQEAPRTPARTVTADKPSPEKANEAPREAEVPRGARAAEAPPRRDAIGDLIRADETTASVTPKPAPAVLQAQRALVKLGYGPLKPDGLMGTGTRAAIEKFERDRKLPVKGEPSGRTLRELAARAGLPPG